MCLLPYLLVYYVLCFFLSKVKYDEESETVSPGSLYVSTPVTKLLMSVKDLKFSSMEVVRAFLFVSFLLSVQSWRFWCCLIPFYTRVKERHHYHYKGLGLVPFIQPQSRLHVQSPQLLATETN